MYIYFNSEDNFMKLTTAQMLTNALANATSIAVENHNKLTVLEILLQKRDPNLFQEYSAALDKVRKAPPTRENKAETNQ